jgi:hypothetical protein
MNWMLLQQEVCMCSFLISVNVPVNVILTLQVSDHFVDMHTLTHMPCSTVAIVSISCMCAI